MLVSGKGIVFHTLRYGDTSLIARIYTREAGLQAFLIKGVRGNKGAIRPSHLLPLNLVEMVFQYRQNQGLQQLKELKCEPVLTEMHVHPVKRGIALFLGELVNRSVQEQEKNGDLFDFLWNKVQMLDLHQDNLQLFPHHFALQLTRYLGFFPSQDFLEGQCFDLSEGIFRSGNSGLHGLPQEESRYLFLLCRNPFGEVAQWQVDPQLRRNLLESVLRYYRLHLDQFRDLRSPEILHEVLSA